MFLNYRKRHIWKRKDEGRTSISMWLGRESMQNVARTRKRSGLHSTPRSRSKMSSLYGKTSAIQIPPNERKNKREIWEKLNMICTVYTVLNGQRRHIMSILLHIELILKVNKMLCWIVYSEPVRGRRQTRKITIKQWGRNAINVQIMFIYLVYSSERHFICLN